jgi:hypothetical protein
MNDEEWQKLTCHALGIPASAARRPTGFSVGTRLRGAAPGAAQGIWLAARRAGSPRSSFAAPPAARAIPLPARRPCVLPPRSRRRPTGPAPRVLRLFSRFPGAQTMTQPSPFPSVAASGAPLRADVYARVTDRIVEDLSRGVHPWVIAGLDAVDLAAGSNQRSHVLPGAGPDIQHAAACHVGCSEVAGHRAGQAVLAPRELHGLSVVLGSGPLVHGSPCEVGHARVRRERRSSRATWHPQEATPDTGQTSPARCSRSNSARVRSTSRPPSLMR